MTDFISNEATRFASIIFNGIGDFAILHTLQERFEKELISFKGIDARKSFLVSLESEINSLFSGHAERCPKPDTCPKLKTFKNVTFLISEELRQLQNIGNLTDLIQNNEDYDRYLGEYEKKIKTTSIFLEKDDFIKQEINRITTLFLEKKIISTFHNATLIAMFDFGKYTKFAYDWLIAGYDLPIDQILKNARREYLATHPSIWDEKEFNNAIVKNLSGGVAYVMYEKFLKEQLKNSTAENSPSIITTNLHIGDNYGQITQAKNVSQIDTKIKISEKRNSTSPNKKHWLTKILSSPWIITILGGLLIAFFAKLFGWV